MNAVRERAAELQPDLELPWSNTAMMVPIFNMAAPLLLHPHVIFENGRASEYAWHDHLESDAPTLVNMSHAEEVDAVLLAPITQANWALRQMRYETLVVARENLGELPYGPGAIVRHGGTLLIKRLFEHPNETPEEKEARHKHNLEKTVMAIAVLNAGGNVVVFSEGGTKKRVKLPDGTFKSVPREPDEQLPAQKGFAEMINGTEPDVRDKLRMMTVVSRYRPVPPNASRYSLKRLTRLMDPTSVILDPAKPVDGDVEAVKQQGQALMARGYELGIELDDLR